jgi:hypothetical protein
MPATLKWRGKYNTIDEIHFHEICILASVAMQIIGIAKAAVSKRRVEGKPSFIQNQREARAFWCVCR